MTAILALDLSGSTGWSFWRPGLEAPLYGVAKLPKGAPGQTFASFRDWLVGKVVGDAVEHLVIESVFVSEKTISSLPRLYGLRGMAQEVAYRRGLSINPDVSPAEWRRHFLGVTTAPRTVPKGDKRRQWLKTKAKEECAKRGWATKTDDEADALGLLVYERARLIPSYGSDGELFGFMQ